MSAFFCVVRAAYYLKQLLDQDVVSEQHCDLLTASAFTFMSVVIHEQQQSLLLSVCLYSDDIMSDSEDR